MSSEHTPSTAAGSAVAPKIAFVSLGCPKALTDSELILTQLRAEGYETSKTYDGADMVIVNTCGFIDDAVKESSSCWPRPRNRRWLWLASPS